MAGAAGGFAKRATISARGGTTGRAAGCPARFGRAGGRNGIPLPDCWCPCWGGCGCAGGGAGTPGPCGRIVGRKGTEGVGIEGTEPATPVTIADGGRGGPAGTPAGTPDGTAGAAGVDAASTGGLGTWGTGAGMGWRGPERICPGRGAGGNGRAGMDGGRGGIGVLCPLANGGRSG